MNTEQLYARVLQIWESTFEDDYDTLMPLVPVPPKAHCLLFVGLNPSFSPSAIRRLLPAEKQIEPGTYFHWRNRGAFDPQVDVSLHEYAKKKQAYFSRLRKFSSMVGVDWDHIDICFYRETSQAKARSRIIEKGSTHKLTDFGQKQFDLSMQLIAEAEPRCIIVANALASDIYKTEKRLEFSTSRGCHPQIMCGRELPVFLSSMLTGQRALDNYSFERLAWNVCRELGTPMKQAEPHNNSFQTDAGARR